VTQTVSYLNDKDISLKIVCKLLFQGPIESFIVELYSTRCNCLYKAWAPLKKQVMPFYILPPPWVSQTRPPAPLTLPYYRPFLSYSANYLYGPVLVRIGLRISSTVKCAWATRIHILYFHYLSTGVNLSVPAPARCTFAMKFGTVSKNGLSCHKCMNPYMVYKSTYWPIQAWFNATYDIPESVQSTSLLGISLFRPCYIKIGLLILQWPYPCILGIPGTVYTGVKVYFYHGHASTQGLSFISLFFKTQQAAAYCVPHYDADKADKLNCYGKY
jgi:hypothetical protein